MKTILTKIGDFFTDRNGDGDIVRLIGIIMVGVGIASYCLGRSVSDCVVFIGIGCGAVITGKLGDAITPKS